MSNPKDYLGNDIGVGDTFVYADSGGRGGSMSLYKGVVTRMTEKQVLVGETRLSRIWRPFSCIVIVAKAVADE